MIFMISCCLSCQKDKKVTLAYSLTLTASSDSYQAPEALQRVQTAEKIEEIEVEVEVGSFFFGCLLVNRIHSISINRVSSCLVYMKSYEVMYKLDALDISGYYDGIMLLMKS